MKNRRTTLTFLAAAIAVPLILSACGQGAEGGAVVIRCDGCQSVDLYETFQAGNVVGVVKPGDEGIVIDKRWAKLYGCMMYEVFVADEQGWVCDKYLSFQ